MTRRTRPLFLLSLAFTWSIAGCDKDKPAASESAMADKAPAKDGVDAETAEAEKQEAENDTPGAASEPADDLPKKEDKDETPKLSGDPLTLAGKTAWEHELNYAKRTYVVALEPLPGGGFAVLTQLTGGDKPLALTMLDAEGETKSHVLAKPVVESDDNDWGSPQFWGLAAVSNTSFVLFGDVETAPTEEEEESGVKVSGQGLVARMDIVAGEPKTIWSKREPMVRTSDVVVRSDGAITVLGSNAGNTSYLATYSAEGIETWRTSFKPVGQRLAGELVALPGGDVLVAATALATGKWGETGLVMRIDADGKEVWRKTVGNDDKNQVLHHARPDGDGIALLFDDDNRYRFVNVGADGTFKADVTFGKADGHTPVSFVRTPFGHVLVGGVDTTTDGLQSRHYVLSPEHEVLGHKDVEHVLPDELIALPNGDVLAVRADPGMEAASRVLRLAQGS